MDCVPQNYSAKNYVAPYINVSLFPQKSYFRIPLFPVSLNGHVPLFAKTPGRPSRVNLTQVERT